jgi:hypothetical protein
MRELTAGLRMLNLRQMSGQMSRFQGDFEDILGDKPLNCEALVYVLTTANILSPISYGHAHSTASFFS